MTTTDRPFDLLVVGEINPDLLLYGDVAPDFRQVEKRVDRAVLTVGSSSVILACAAARLGLRVAFVGLCGPDLFGDFMLAEMQRRGVDTRWVQRRSDGSTGLSVILQKPDGARAILTAEGLIPALRAEDVPDEALAAARHVHVSSFYLQRGLQPGLGDLFRRARAMGSTTSLDPNYDPDETWHSILPVLPEVDVFLPNAAEARAIAGVDDVAAAARNLAARGPLVVVKWDVRGALAVSPQGQQWHVPAVPAPTVVDAVGAGDNFDAGFLYGYLHGWPLARSLRLAAACGALSLRGPGGTGAQPTLEEALAYVAA